MKSKTANSHSEFFYNRNLLNSKRSQGWGMDLIIAVTIFTFGLVAFYIYSLNSPNETKEKIRQSAEESLVKAGIVNM